MLSVPLDTVIDVVGTVITAVPLVLAVKYRTTLVHRFDLEPDGRRGLYRVVVLARRPVVGMPADIVVPFAAPITVTAGALLTTRIDRGRNLVLEAANQLTTGKVYEIGIAATGGDAALGLSDAQAGLRISRAEEWDQRNRRVLAVSGVAAVVLAAGALAVTVGVLVDPDPVTGLLGICAGRCSPEHPACSPPSPEIA